MSPVLLRTMLCVGGIRFVPTSSPPLLPPSIPFPLFDVIKARWTSSPFWKSRGHVSRGKTTFQSGDGWCRFSCVMMVTIILLPYHGTTTKTSHFHLFSANWEGGLMLAFSAEYSAKEEEEEKMTGPEIVDSKSRHYSTCSTTIMQRSLST